MLNQNPIQLVVELLEKIKVDPCLASRYPARDREYLGWALASASGVTCAISDIEDFVSMNGKLPVAGVDAVDTREYVLALAVNGLKQVFQHSGQVVDGHIMPEISREQISRLAVFYPQHFQTDLDSIKETKPVRVRRGRNITPARRMMTVKIR